MKFYICKHCGNIIAYVRSSGVPVVCCGEPMQEIIPGTTDGALEKHVPVIEVEGNKVTSNGSRWRRLRATSASLWRRARSRKPCLCWPRATALWPRTSTATCTACGRPEKAPLCGARVLPHTASSKKRVPYRKVWGAFFISIALFQPARPCRAPQAARRPHLWKRLKRAVKSCPVYSISWFRVLYWKSSGECISAARTYAGKGAFSE